MKLECTQCGARLAVTSPDAYMTCTYCGARAVVSGFTGENLLHRPVLSREDAERLFPAGTVASASVYWFPYDPGTLERIFTQPYAEMESYSPPSADRRLWEGRDAETVIPVDPDLAGSSGVLYHPFWVVIRTPSGQGVIVDAVSGAIVGEDGGSGKAGSFDPYRESIKAFAMGVLPAVAVFFLFKGLSLFWASVMAMAAGIFTSTLWDRLRGGRE